ncbi:hypothetical protein [Tolypothrix sp. VBCCA 56010]
MSEIQLKLVGAIHELPRSDRAACIGRNREPIYPRPRSQAVASERVKGER